MSRCCLSLRDLLVGCVRTVPVPELAASVACSLSCIAGTAMWVSSGDGRLGDCCPSVGDVDCTGAVGVNVIGVDGVSCFCSFFCISMSLLLGVELDVGGCVDSVGDSALSFSVSSCLGDGGGV